MWLLPFGIAGLISWSIWLVRRTLSHRARPVVNDFRTTTSVVVPVYREDLDVLRECLATWIAEEPDELILVVDLDDHDCLEMLDDAVLPSFVHVLPFRHTGKRSALGEGIRAARYDIVVLSDSDTAWTPGVLREVQMPFADPTVGGVGTRQSVAGTDTSIWRRVAAWMLNTRYLDYVPAMGAQGSVPCLSGRTVAYRRELIVPMIPDLEHEWFLGRECVSGDDGRLTWLVIASGHRTVHQDSAHAVSMFPATLHGFLQQRLRWSRNSYRCYLTAIWNGWLFRQPVLTQLTVLQILLTPLTMGIALAYLVHGYTSEAFLVATIYLLWLMIGRGIRSASHLREHPEDIVLLPLMTVVTMFVAVPLKLYALLTMNRQGWLTRHDGHDVPAGQSRASLGDRGVLS
jgi:hyaluronan synthase